MKLRSLKGIGRGSLFSIIIYCLLIFILSLIMMNFSINEKYYKIFYCFISLLSLAIGAVFAAKYNGKKGFLMGFFVALIFSIFLSVITFMSSECVVINGEFFKRFLINIILGIICGSLGVNI